MVPFRLRDRTIGALALVLTRDGHGYDEDHVASALRLAELCGVAADRAGARAGFQNSLAVLDATFATARWASGSSTASCASCA